MAQANGPRVSKETELLEELAKLPRGATFAHVPAHEGVEGNEAVDSLINEVYTRFFRPNWQLIMNNVPRCPVSHEGVKSLVRGVFCGGRGVCGPSRGGFAGKSHLCLAWWILRRLAST